MKKNFYLSPITSTITFESQKIMNGSGVVPETESLPGNPPTPGTGSGLGVPARKLYI